MNKKNSNRNLVFLEKNKVIDVEEASIEELQEAENIVKDKLLEIFAKKVKRDSIFYKVCIPTIIAETALIFFVTRHLYLDILNLNLNSDTKVGLDIFNGMGSLLAALGINIGFDKILDKFSKVEELEKSQARIKYKKNIKKVERRGTQELEGVAKVFTEGIELDEYQENLKQMVVEDLLKNGADPKIVNMPVIQNILIYELSRPVPEPMQRRAFSYSPEHREIREDGTFDIAPCIKDYKYSFPVKIDYERYVIKYCEEPTEDHYLVIHCPDPKEYYLKEYQKIYLDKEGNITEITKEVRSTLLKYPVNVSIKPKKLELKRDNENE